MENRCSLTTSLSPSQNSLRTSSQPAPHRTPLLFLFSLKGSAECLQEDAVTFPKEAGIEAHLCPCSARPWVSHIIWSSAIRGLPFGPRHLPELPRESWVAQTLHTVRCSAPFVERLPNPTARLHSAPAPQYEARLFILML